jgi:hypothetical protein
MLNQINEQEHNNVLYRVWEKWHTITMGTSREPQNKTKMWREEISRRNFYITVKWDKYINHAVGGPRVIGHDVQCRKYEDGSLWYYDWQWSTLSTQ